MSAASWESLPAGSRRGSKLPSRVLSCTGATFVLFCFARTRGGAVTKMTKQYT
jgi:hypothetical protein